MPGQAWASSQAHGGKTSPGFRSDARIRSASFETMQRLSANQCTHADALGMSSARRRMSSITVSTQLLRCLSILTKTSSIFVRPRIRHAASTNRLEPMRPGLSYPILSYPTLPYPTQEWGGELSAWLPRALPALRGGGPARRPGRQRRLGGGAPDGTYYYYYCHHYYHYDDHYHVYYRHVYYHYYYYVHYHYD